MTKWKKGTSIREGFDPKEHAAVTEAECRAAFEAQGPNDPDPPHVQNSILSAITQEGFRTRYGFLDQTPDNTK